MNKNQNIKNIISNPNGDNKPNIVIKIDSDLDSNETASSEKIIAWTSNLKGTEASPNSLIRSIGSNLLVIPTLNTLSPNDPIFEIT